MTAPDVPTPCQETMPNGHHPTEALTPSWMITVNGQPCVIAPGTHLAGLLAQLGGDLPPSGYATALNGAFVPRSKREHTPLNVGDAVTTFQAIVGG